jgi:hypothetical protein
MKNYFIGGLAVLAVLGFFAGRVTAPTKLGYNPSTQSYQGFIHSLSTSTAIATTDFCSNANVQWLGTAAVATATLPAATTTFAACPTLNNVGASVSGLIVNDSTNTIDYAPGVGDVFKCQATSFATTTLQAGCTGGTAGTLTVLASTTVQYTAYFDSSSSTFKVAFSSPTQ